VGGIPAGLVPFLLGIALVLALALVAWLLGWRLFAVAAADPKGGASPALAAEIARERSLRIELAALADRAVTRHAQCVPPAPPAKLADASPRDLPPYVKEPPPQVAALPEPKVEPPKLEPPKPEPPKAEIPKPKPEAKLPEPKPEPKKEEPRKDDNLKLPDEKRQDLTFLKGCWYNLSTLQNRQGDSIKAEFCFDEKGQGKMTVDGPHGRCQGDARARFDGPGQLRIEGDQASCPQGSHYNPVEIDCQGSSARDARCQGRNLPDRSPFAVQLKRSG
jgi:hypothetical protein